MKLLSWIYASILYFYPPGFRRMFAGEMQAVFCEALEDARAQGWKTAFRLLWRELKDLSAGLLRELWYSLDDWMAQPAQDPASMSLETSRPDTWLRAGLAALPHLLFALAIYLPLLVAAVLDLPLRWGPSLPVFWGMGVLALFIASRSGWPRWSSTWIGYALVFALGQGSARFTSGLLVYLGIILWISLAVILILWLARRDWISGLLAVLPVSPMWVWLSSFDGLPDSLQAAALYLSLSLMLALAVAIIARVGRWQTALLLLLALILAAGLPGSDSLPFGDRAASRTAGSASPGEAGGWLRNYAVLFILTAPLWLMALWRQSQRRVRETG